MAAFLLAEPPPVAAQVCGDGTLDVGEQCDDGNLLDDDCCSSACAIEPAATVCRPATGVCDAPESCDGVSPTCPADLAGPAGVECHPSAGGCDPAETCDGTSTVCPTDFLYPAGSFCRPPAGDCDVAERCDGVSSACPADVVSPVGTTCRTTTDACDVAETCDGASAFCPMDGFAPAGVTCRFSVGACDVAESCTGTGAACPIDGSAPAGTVCRPVGGLCDVAEACDGASAFCPTDGFVGAGTVCRSAAGVCDAVEACNGASASCPTNGSLPDGTACSGTDICAGASACTGGVCRGVTAVAAGQVCRPIAGPCDIAETCDGVVPACPADGVRPTTSVCRGAAGACDLPEYCNGTAVSCPADAKRTTECRPAASSCDAPEYCTGLGNHCPTNLSEPNGSFCVDDGNPCTRDLCQNGSCSHVAGNTGVLCRAALDLCDVPETCTGDSASCPADVIAPDGIACDDGLTCTGGDQCSGGACRGVSLTCGNGVVECGEDCDDGNAVGGDDCSSTCTVEEICGDLIDNEGDGRLDCVEAECASTCGALVNGGAPPRPSRISLRQGGLDRVRIFGAVQPTTPFDPATERFAIALGNGNGVLLVASVPPGGLLPHGDARWVFRDPNAKTGGGFSSVVVKRGGDGPGAILRFTIAAFGDLAGATDPNISVQVLIGDDEAIHTSAWTELRSAFKTLLP